MLPHVAKVEFDEFGWLNNLKKKNISQGLWIEVFSFYYYFSKKKPFLVY